MDASAILGFNFLTLPGLVSRDWQFRILTPTPKTVDHQLCGKRFIPVDHRKVTI